MNLWFAIRRYIFLLRLFLVSELRCTEYEIEHGELAHITPMKVYPKSTLIRGRTRLALVHNRLIRITKPHIRAATTPTRISPTTAPISTSVSLAVQWYTACDSLTYTWRLSMRNYQLTANKYALDCKDVTSTSASVFKYSTTVTQVLPVMPRLKAWNYFQHSTLPAVHEKNNSKYNTPTATVQYLEIVSASDSRNSSKLYSPRPQLLPFDRQELLSATHPSDHSAPCFIP